MELIYSMRRKPLKCEPPYFESTSDPDVTRPICTISIANIIAFSSLTELSDSDGKTWGGHVYVCDLDTPWDSHKVTSTTHPVSALEWDSEGKQLVVGTTVGDLSVYMQKEYLLNEWTCSYSVNFPGEHIVRAAFFNNGRRVVMSDKKQDSAAAAAVTDRVQLLRATPTLQGFGGVAQPGVCVVGASGIVGVVVEGAGGVAGVAGGAAGVVGGGGEPAVLTEPLSAHSERVTAAAIAVTHSGAIVIASVSGAGRVRCSSCRAGVAQLTVTPLPAVCVPRDLGLPTAVRWCGEEADSLLVVGGGGSGGAGAGAGGAGAGGSVSVWQLATSAQPVHKLLAKPQGNTTPPSKADSFSTLCWQQAGSWSLPPPAPPGPPAPPHPRGVPRAACAARHACLVATERAVHLLQPRGQVLSTAVVTSGGGEAAATSPPKKAKYGHGALPSGSRSATVSCIQTSALGGVLVVLDTHSQLHVYKLLNHLPSAVNNSVREACGLLEYAAVSGTDCVDLLLALTHAQLDALYDRVTESFQRQPPAFQQFYFQSWLTLRCTLLRVSPTQQTAAGALASSQAVWAAWAGCLAALRADDLDDHTLNDEKSVVSLEARSEATASSAEAVALRRALRRVAHTARALLAAALPVPHQAHHPHLTHHHNKYELHSDATLVSVLRRLVPLSRPAADALLRPLARLHAAAPPPADLLEEFAVITSQMIAPRIFDSLPRCSVSSPHERAWPLYFEYGVEPEALRYNPEPPASQCDTTPTPDMDSIRYMYIGGGGSAARWRQCGRCGSHALAAAHAARHPHQRAFDARYLVSCRCGGKWTLRTNI